MYDPTNDPQYTEQNDIWNRQQTADTSAYEGQLGDTKNTFANRKQDLIRSYQDTLDQLNFGLRQAGVGLRSSYATRGLYDANGEVSGVGQGVASNVLEPLNRQVIRSGERYRKDVLDLGTEEDSTTADLNRKIAGVPLTYDQNRLDLKNKLIGSIKDQAAKAEEQAGKPRVDQLKERTAQQGKGRVYLSNPKAVAEARKKYGADAIFSVGRDTFLLSPKERVAAATSKLDQQLKIKNLNKSTSTRVPTSPSLQRSNVYGPNGQQIGFGLYNPKSGKTEYTNLNGSQSINLPQGATVGSAPKSAVDPSVRSDLVDDINGGASLDQLFHAYPEMSVQEITSIYNSL